MTNIVLNPKSTALLIQDMQNDLLKGSWPVKPLDSGTLIANCGRLLAKARAVGMPVIYVRVSRRPDMKDAPRAPLGAKAGSGKPFLVEGAWGSEIVSELTPHPEDPVVTKHTTSPFHTTDIGVYLRRFGITTLILTGYSTTGVVEGMLRDARDFDYYCVVARDCCAAGTEQEHDACMDVVFPRMAWVASADDIIDAIQS